MKEYRVKLELTEKNEHVDFLKRTACNIHERRKKLIHVRGYCNKFDALQYAVWLSREYNILLDDLIIINDGNWWDIYVDRSIYDRLK